MFVDIAQLIMSSLQKQSSWLLGGYYSCTMFGM